MTTGFFDDSSDDDRLASSLDRLLALRPVRVLDEVLKMVLDSALEIASAERGFMMLADSDGELQFTIARDRGGTTPSEASFTIGGQIAREVFRTGQSCRFGDLTEDGDRAGRHVLCVPLTHVAMSTTSTEASRTLQIIGVIYLDARERRTIVSDATRASLEAFATRAVVAIDSTRRYDESATQARLDRDLRIAADIQRALLPDPTFEAAGIADLAAASIPCRAVGGDFFDYIDAGERGLCFALGDVAGKGPPAALLAAIVQDDFAVYAPISDSPADAMTRINEAFLRRAVEARIATMFYGAITSAGRLSYCNAGHEPPLVVRADDMSWLTEGGPVLGVLSIATYVYDTVPLRPGDLVVVYTDGVIRARNQAGEEFGRDRLTDALRGRHGSSPDVALEHLLGAVEQFSRGATQPDDITLLVVRYGNANATNSADARSGD